MKLKSTILHTTYYILPLLFPIPALADIPIGDRLNPPFKNLTDVGALVTTLLSNAYVIAGLVLLFLIIFWALGLMSNSGTKDPQKLAKGKGAITAAIIGFLIIFSSYWIIQLVELLTGVNIF